MKALVLREYNRLVYEEAPAPEFGPNDVLIGVKACGICGSDVHGMDGSTGRRRPPLIMGHEAAGIIIQTGSGVSAWKPGDRVTFDSTLSCGTCEFCRRGQVNLCDQRRVLGVSCEEYSQPGAFAELVAVPARILYRLPDSVSYEHAALVEPFAVALHAVNRNRHGLNASAVVIGCGMIGLALVQTLRLAGCGLVVAVDVSPEKLKMAEKMGAETVDSSATDALAAILRLTHRRGADTVFEAVGVAATVDLAVRSARKGGSITLAGNLAAKVEIPLQIAVTRELTLYGTCASSGEYPACLDLMARGVLNVSPLLSAVAPLREGAAWFERLARKDNGLFKVILAP
jgi:L-iditol 2-dehydrogenase